MTHAWRHRAASVAMLLVVACQDAPTTPLEPSDDAGGGLTFFIPDLDPSMFVVGTTEVADAVAVGPARSVEEAEEEPDWGSSTGSAPAADIWDYSTTAFFLTGSASSRGQHMYQGNKGKVTTTVTVFLDGAEIGRQSAHTLKDVFFIADFGLPNHVQAEARAFVNQECGLTARGDSLHEAWWEPVPLDITSFGRAERTSSSLQPARQPDCPPPSPPSTGGGGGGGGVCYVEFWYYEDSGEIIDWRVLYCEQAGG